MKLDWIFTSHTPETFKILDEVSQFRRDFGDAALFNLMNKTFSDGMPQQPALKWVPADKAALREAMLRYRRHGIAQSENTDGSDEAVAARSGKTKSKTAGPLNAMTKMHRMSLIADVACKTIAFLKKHDPEDLNDILNETIFSTFETSDWTQMSNRELKALGEALGRALNRPAKAPLPGTLLIRVEGAQGAGKTRLIENTIIPALKLHGYLPAPTSGVIGSDAEQHQVSVLPPANLPEGSVLAMIPKAELLWLAAKSGKEYHEAVALSAERGNLNTVMKNRVRFLGRVYSRLRELAGHTDSPERLI